MSRSSLSVIVLLAAVWAAQARAADDNAACLECHADPSLSYRPGRRQDPLAGRGRGRVREVGSRRAGALLHRLPPRDDPGPRHRHAPGEDQARAGAEGVGGLQDVPRHPGRRRHPPCAHRARRARGAGLLRVPRCPRHPAAQGLPHPHPRAVRRLPLEGGDRLRPERPRQGGRTPTTTSRCAPTATGRTRTPTCAPARSRCAPPIICGRCHTDPKRMKKYGISTNVVSTYLSDFHGMATTLQRGTEPGQGGRARGGVHRLPRRARHPEGRRPALARDRRQPAEDLPASATPTRRPGSPRPGSRTGSPRPSGRRRCGWCSSSIGS